MDRNTAIITVPVHKSHAHMTDYIESFPGMHEGPSLEEMHNSTIKKLREEYLRGTNFEDSPTLN